MIIAMCVGDVYARYQRRWSEMEAWTKAFCFIALANYVCLVALAAAPFFVTVRLVLALECA